ncbi:hypothetical protein [Klenkia taihuensis]|uniref:Gram-positive cocci surface proteins LPxTG domain-containing protein n=1 Tax=Klenkia taihuensis TaxID=1225127 RepID=A0A1I1NIB2_9ACTN|nr:hypothetical protein [Klenkia taihuensis]GHE11929.1 hypothetical protein GCM10011381_27580 [Klenkia taihuensis]SFC97156.1 hypothetical protein SAMN05661030_2131 [Klenkia taihuensis]
MTSRARLSRRPLQVGGLLLATVALGTVTAPAASAMVDPTAPADQTPEQAPALAPVVLTNSPASYLGTPEEPVDFGMGKLQISVAPDPDVDAPEEEDMSGAVVEVAFPDDTDETGTPSSVSCTTDQAGDCAFPEGSDYVDPDTGLLRVWPGQTFTITQVQAPSSGLFDLPAGDDAVVHGVGTWQPVEFPGELVPVVDAPGTTMDFAPSVTPAGDGMDRDGVTGSIVFYDPLEQLSGGQPGDPSVAPGAPAPDPVAEAAPVIPVVPSAATPAATAAPTLATTGFDAVPAALVGGGLLVAGAGAVVAGRRRAAR